MRSWQSFLVECLLKLTRNKFDPGPYLAKKKIENQAPYVLPTKLQRKYGILKSNRYSIDTYLLKSPAEPNQRQILFLPGGGYTEQPLMWHWRFLHRLAQQLNGTITVPIYPKAPTYDYKETFAQVLPIYKDLLTKTSPDRIVIMGDSAGGGLTLALSQLILCEGLPQPGNIILLSPWLDVSLSHPEVAAMDRKEPMLNLQLLIESGKAYAGKSSTNDYLVSPINGPLQGLGNISLFIGTHEFFLPDARRLKARADREKVAINYYEYPKMNHVFPVFPIPEAKRAMRQIIDIITHDRPRHP